MPTKTWHGTQAVEQAMQYYGLKMVDPIAEHIIREEGFSIDEYEDTKGIKTAGVGQTREFRDKNFFREVLPTFEQRAKRLIPSYPRQPLDVRKAIMSAVYRGDMGPKTAEHLDNKDYQKAAQEFLDHREYRKLKRKDPDHGVVKRMERIAETFRQAGK